jgi:hypothetical protein
MNLIRTLVASRGGLDNLGHDGFTKCQLLQYVKASEVFYHDISN